MPHGTTQDGRPSPVDYDAELQRHNEVLRRACDVGPGDRVLDIGCGTGQTTRQAARTAVAGSALGIDVSAPAIARARELAQAEGLHNVTFECGDAQVHHLPRARFDLAISRFGTMFFHHPVAAFTNIGQALRPSGRLMMMVWQAREHNEWEIAIQHSLAGGEATPPVASEEPDPFSLADTSTVRDILQAAGFAGITFTDVQEPVYYGPDVTAALAWVRGFSSTSHMLKHLDPTAAALALRRLRDALAEHVRADGIWFHARAWIITAHRDLGPVAG